MVTNVGIEPSVPIYDRMENEYYRFAYAYDSDNFPLIFQFQIKERNIKNFRVFINYNFQFIPILVRYINNQENTNVDMETNFLIPNIRETAVICFNSRFAFYLDQNQVVFVLSSKKRPEECGNQMIEYKNGQEKIFETMLPNTDETSVP